MKKIIVVALAICMVLTATLSFSGCTPRNQKLIIYNWGEYMDDDTWKGFEDYYKRQTGKKVKVEYRTFDANEDMYTAINNKKADYDLVVPSDYTVEKMKKAGLLKEFSEETKKIVHDVINPELESLLQFDEDEEYYNFSMPYLWGTMGIMYNSKTQTKQNMSTWDALFSGEYGKDKIYMKDSVRDAYTAAMLWENKDELMTAKDDIEEYRKILNKIFSEVDQDKIDTAEEILKAQKTYVKKYEIDSAKTDMLTDTDGEFGMFWSCDAGYIMSEDGNSTDLRYVVPEEGGNVWVDCFVIPKYAKNVDAANMFIQYMCQKEVAYECMDYAGCTSAVKDAADQYRLDLESGENDFLQGASQEFIDMYLEMMFPSQATLNRCAVMRDFGSFTTKLDKMWENVYKYKP